MGVLGGASHPQNKGERGPRAIPRVLAPYSAVSLPQGGAGRRTDGWRSALLLLPLKFQGWWLADGLHHSKYDYLT